MRIDRAVERIARFPEAAPNIAQRSNVRVVPLVRYPYVIHYAIIGSEVIIFRIRHGARQNPWEQS